MGSTNDDEEAKIREVEVPCSLNIAAALLQNQVRGLWIEYHSNNIEVVYQDLKNFYNNK